MLGPREVYDGTGRQVTRDQLATCTISRRPGSQFLQTAVVPMWVVYQFFVRQQTLEHRINQEGARK